MIKSTTSVPVAEWDGDLVLLRRVGALRIAEYIDAINSMPDEMSMAEGVRMSALLVSITISDENGGRPYDTDEGRTRLQESSVETLELLAKACKDINGMEEDAKKN